MFAQAMTMHCNDIMTETTLSECSADATIVPGSGGRGKNISQFTADHRLLRP
jgi:hypothetical protein